MKITEALLAEHQVFHSLFDQVEQMTPQLKTLAEIKVLAALLESSLKAHSDSEDDLLFAPLEHCIEQLGQAEPFHDEHEEIDSTLGKIKSAKQVSQARHLLLSAVLASRRHFDKEERFIFPLAEQTLSPQSLEKLGESWAARRRGAV